MSKIYEALRRAQLENADAPTAGETAPSAGETAPPVAEITRPLASALSQAVSLTAHPAVAAADDKPLMTATPVREPDANKAFDRRIAKAQDEIFSPANISPEAWVPSLHQLPALEARGASVEQFRSLRSRLQQFRDLNPLKSILVSSGLPKEGKSFVAANLAISFARHKSSRVLLIDGDMRRATLYKMLGAPEGPGLTEYLAGQATLPSIMQCAKPSADGRPLPQGLASLCFIPGGHASDKAADLSGNRRFDRLIAEAAPHFDWIVVDSSPVNLVSDGVNLARACDGVLLVARGGTTKYEVAQRALAELKASNILGFVLNAVQGQPVAGGYYGYDGYDKINV